MDEDGQSLERGEVCTGTGSAIVSGRSKQAGAPSVSAQELEGQPLQNGCCWRGPAGFSKQKDEREVCSESYAPGEPKEWTGWRSGKCLRGEGPDNTMRLQPRARRPCASVGREASRLEHKVEASSGTGPGRPGVAEGRGVKPKARAGRARVEKKAAIWLILPGVICLSQRLSHACLSISRLYCETANGSLNQL